MNKVVIEALEGKFNYKLLGAIKKESMLSTKEFSDFYNEMEANLPAEACSYIFVSALRAILRYAERSKITNKAVLNQCLQLIMSTNSQITLEMIEVYKAIIDNVSSRDEDQDQYLERFNRLYTHYQALKSSTVQNTIITYDCLNALSRLLGNEYLIDYDIAAVVFDDKEAITEPYNDLIIYLKSKGMMIW